MALFVIQLFTRQFHFFTGRLNERNGIKPNEKKLCRKYQGGSKDLIHQHGNVLEQMGPFFLVAMFFQLCIL